MFSALVRPLPYELGVMTRQVTPAENVQARSHSRLDRGVILAAGIYLGTALLTVGIAVWVLQLWRADWAVPMHLGRYGDDYLFFDMMAKNVVENGLHNRNPFLGAPGRCDLYDFPLPHAVHFFFLRLISLFRRDFAVALNVYFVMSFLLSAVIALFVFRRFRISYPSAILGSVLFAFLPYHFIRGEDQMIYAAYYLVPLTFLMSLWLCTGEPLFRFECAADDTNRAWVTPNGAIGLASCVLIASDSPYYAFFCAFFLVIAGLVGRFRYAHPRAVLSSAILVVVLVSTFALSLAPNLIFIYQHRRNYEVTNRKPEESELYGAKIAQLVLPITGHRLPLLAAVKERYNQQAPLVNGNDSASLGLIGTTGFLALILLLIFGKPHRTPPLLDALSVLNVSGVLLATVGGFSSLFAFLISPTIRNYNRLSVFIGFAALFAVVLLLERVREFCATRVWATLARTGLFGLLIVSLLVLGVLDQTTPGFIPNYPELRTEYESDAAFVKRIEASLPENAMVFQLPYIPFPEVVLGRDSLIYEPLLYEHLRGYLHSRNLRWSYGAINGREDDAWEKNVAAMPIREMVETLVFAGFGGLYVDRFGYSDHGAQLESDLADQLGTKPILSANQRMSFFPIIQVNAAFREKYTPQEWQMKEDAALHPILADWRLGFYQLEGSREQNWRWCCYFSRGELFIFNLSPSPKRTQFEMVVSTRYPELSHLVMETPWFSKEFEVSAESRSISIIATVPPGRHVIRFMSDAKPVEAGDRRTLIFRISDFRTKSLN